MGKMPLALASAACKNISEISSIKQNTPELIAEENWTDWKGNLQMENLEKQKTGIPPPLLKRKTQPTTIFGRTAKEEATKKQPKNCASLRQTPLNGDGRYHWGWVPCRMRCIEGDCMRLGRGARIGSSIYASRLENDTLVVLLLLLGGRRLEGSNDGLRCVNWLDSRLRARA